MKSSAKDSGTNWLVRSNGRILGPFKKDEIGQLLKTRELATIDEASQPGSRWASLKDLPAFAKIIADIRDATMNPDTGELTLTTSAESFTQTMTSSLGEGVRDDLTEKIQALGAQPGAEIVYEDLEDRIEAFSQQNSGNARYQSARQGPQSIDRQVKKTTGFLWALTGLILFSAIGFVFLDQMEKKRRGQSLVSGDYFESAVAAYELGDFSKALSDFKRVEAEHQRFEDVDYFLGVLLVSQEGQTLVGRRFLSQYAERGAKYLADAFAGLALADLVDLDLASAKQNSIRALAENPSHVPALVNLAFVEKTQKNNLEAQKLLDRARQSDNRNAMVQMMRLKLSLDLVPRGNIEQLRILEKRLTEFADKFYDYRQEAYFVRAHVRNYMNDLLGMEEDMIRALDSDPYLTRDHRHDPLIFQKFLDATFFASICQSSYERSQKSAQLSAFLAVCLSRYGQVEEASRWIDSAILQAPRDALVVAAYAFVLEKANRPDQSLLAVGKASELNRDKIYSLPILLQARFCSQSEDWPCVRERWTELKNREGYQLQATVGLAEYARQMKIDGDYVKFKNEAANFSVSYKPLVRFQMLER